MEALRDSQNKENYENELLLYFDVLSVNKRVEITGINNFTSSIEIFENLINLLNDFKFNEIKNYKYYKDLDICGRKKLIASKIFSYKNYQENYLEKVKKDRKRQKVTINNPEIYFNYLLQLYFRTIEKADEKHLKNIAEITFQLFKLIKNYLLKIETNYIFSTEELKIMYIILFTPIIADNRYSDVNRINFSFEEMNINNNLNNSFNNINNKKTKTIEKEKIFLEYTHEMSDGTDKLNKIPLEKPYIYNLNPLKKELEIKKTNFDKIDFLKYVKIQHFQDNNFYTYDKIYWEFNKKLLKHVLHSTTIRDIYKNLYPNKHFIFEDNNNINLLINNIIFVPYPIYESYGCTYKDELTIFINGLVDSFSKQIIYLSKSASFIILGISCFI